MKKSLMLCATAVGVMFIAPVFAEEAISLETQSKTKIEKDADGNYQRKRTSSAKSVDANGTLSSSETKVNVEADAQGNEEKSVTTEEVIDPKGLMNKSKTVTKDSVKYKNGKTVAKHQKKVNGRTVEENLEEQNNAAR